ncbi:uncharacterized protein N7525_006528 [Penicillium rubens]|uniref:uncharacterized protein n=1 Tax=Penicillium rubens TaxID=1108849 RepID=UPI002A5A97AE|nr:uncharacterized protein N7525_006528 [Penicillium rubens]KAJ5828275.1 hypothetical protein N7525_006528 [Penicillium rubens]KAJ5841997.1 hypothetical protein N7534_011827 [Penicillium rubens]
MCRPIFTNQRLAVIATECAVLAVPHNVAGRIDRESQQRAIGAQLDSDDWRGKLAAVFMLSVALGARSWDTIQLS